MPSSHKASRCRKELSLLDLQKEPNCFQGGDVLIPSERRGFKQSLQKILLQHLFDSQKEPPLLKECRREFNCFLQRFEPTPPKWQAEIITITPCHSTF